MTKCFLALFAFVAVQTEAQQPSPTPPQPPLIKRAPDKTQWTILYKIDPIPATAGGSASPSGAGKEQPPRTKTRTVIKENGLILERTVNENGAVNDQWHLPNHFTLVGVNGKDWVLAPSIGTGFDSVDYSVKDFSGFDWLTPESYLGEKIFNGRRCFVFQGRVVTAEPSELQAIQSDISRDFSWMELDEKGNPKAPSEAMKARQRHFNLKDYENPAVAYIDEETRLPVGLVYRTPFGVVTRMYWFQAASAPLQIPPEAQSVLKTTQERQRHLSVGKAPI